MKVKLAHMHYLNAFILKNCKFKTSQYFKSIVFALSTIFSNKTYRLENETLRIPLIFLLVYTNPQIQTKAEKTFREVYSWVFQDKDNGMRERI